MDDHRHHHGNLPLDNALLHKLELQIATLIAQDQDHHHNDPRKEKELDLGLALSIGGSPSTSLSLSCERSSSSPSSSLDTGDHHSSGKKPWLTLGFGASLGSSGVAVTSPASSRDLCPLSPPARDLKRKSSSSDGGGGGGDDPVACIFCGSATRFDYFNNHRHDQPRRRCLKCKRKFTPGAKLRGEERKRLAKLFFFFFSFFSLAFSGIVFEN